MTNGWDVTQRDDSHPRCSREGSLRFHHATFEWRIIYNVYIIYFWNFPFIIFSDGCLQVTGTVRSKVVDKRGTAVVLFYNSVLNEYC